jgi:streptomycin 6-kinase
MLLHGDLHHENILSTTDGYRAIDPKGLVGDPGYEVGCIFYNPIKELPHVHDLPKLFARRLDQLSAELHMDRQRLRGWAIAQCVLSAWWHMEDGYEEPAPDSLQYAEILSNLN